MITVIIPAYNAAKTIKRAVLSAVREIPDSEIIVVENGSSDNTSELVLELADAYKNVFLRHSEKGVSAARNIGIDCANGEWIVFLDADDYFETDIHQTITDSISDLATDLWLFGHIAGREKRGVTDSDTVQCFSQNDISQARVMMLENPTRFMEVWGKIFKSSLIRENNIRFNELLSLSEDSDFTLKYTRYCKRICFSPSYIYHYSLDDSSVMRTKDGTKVKKYVLAMNETKKELEIEPEEIKLAFRKYVLMHMNIAMVREIFVVTGVDQKWKEKKATMISTTMEPVFYDAIQDTKIKECFSLRMLPVLLIKLHFWELAAKVYDVRAKQNAKREKK